MSLLRLLTAGRSLVGSKNPETRYHLSRPGALPKFGAKKNPFRVTTKPEAAQSAAPAPANPVNEPAGAVVPTPVLRTSASIEVSPIGSGATATASGPGPTRAEEAAAPPTTRGQGRGALARCTGKLKSLLELQRPRGAEPAALRAAKPMVQAELSLERVRVVRNDLSDSDVEIVPIRPLATGAADKPTDGAWGKVAGRLFGAGKA